MSLPQNSHTACRNPTKINPETSSNDKRKLTVSHDKSPQLKACLNPQNNSDGSAHPLQGVSQPKPRGIAGHSNMTASYLNTHFTENLFLNDNTENDLEESNLPNLMDQYLETAQINQLSLNGSFSNTFSALSLNIRSIVKTENFNKLEAFLANMEFKPHIIFITETWIKQSSTGPYKNLEGYQFASNCRKDCNGGGVAFYVKNDISFNVCDDLTIMKEKEFESLFIKITLSRDTLMCGTIYRTTQNDNDSHHRFFYALNDCLKKIDLTTRCFSMETIITIQQKLQEKAMSMILWN